MGDDGDGDGGACGALTLEAVPGFFVQGQHGAGDPVAPYAPRLGLVPGRTWADVEAELETPTTSTPTGTKLVVFLRHGEGRHNADKARAGESAWERELQFADEYVDAPLTETGVTQSHAAGRLLQGELDRGLGLDLVVVSPLQRTLSTYREAIAGLDLVARNHVPVLAVELARETLGVCPCDRRQPVTSTTRGAHPEVDFANVPSEADPWWTPTHRETDKEIEARARRFLTWLHTARPERQVLVVSHNGFIRACFRALGHPYYRPANGECIPVLVRRRSPPPCE